MWQNLMLKFIPIIIKQATPEIKKGVNSILSDLKKKAKATPNPFDDMLIDMLESLFCDD